MNPATFDPSQILLLLGTLGGAAVGAAVTIVVALITSRAETKRHLQRLSLEAAIKDWEVAIDHAKHEAESRGEPVASDPLVSFLHFNSRVIDLVGRNKLSTETLEAIFKSNDQLRGILNSMSRHGRIREEGRAAEEKG